jgi:uncharacterized protein YaiI (UPF0178 family)
MRILVDADACPVKNEVMIRAKKHGLEVHFYVDVNHRMEGYNAVVHVVDQGADSADLALVNGMQEHDIVVSADYGVASLALARKGYVIHPLGKEISNANIDQLMFERHISREERKRGRRGPKHKKRTIEDNRQFEQELERLILKYKG